MATAVRATIIAAGLLTVAGLSAAPTSVSADVPAVTWHAWRQLPGIFDVAGPRSDGRLVAAAGGKLFLIDTQDQVTPFATGPGGYAVESGPEAYIALSAGWHLPAAGCDFARDDLFALHLAAHMGVDRIDASGRVSPFAEIRGVDTLAAIAFDDAGRFGHRLLVAGPHSGRTVVDALDCRGGVTTITDSAPAFEGGMAVAPPGFGSHGGELIAPDELSGRIIAVAPDGSSSVLAESGLPMGGDVGVESAGFVPAGFETGGHAYLADRLTPGNPHVGTDTLLRLDARILSGAGVRAGDLLVASEASGLTIDVRCGAPCTVTRLAGATVPAHIEGHLLMVADHPAPAASALPEAAALGASNRLGQLVRAAVVLLVVAGAATAAGAVVLWRRRLTRSA